MSLLTYLLNEILTWLRQNSAKQHLTSSCTWLMFVSRFLTAHQHS